MSKSPRAMEGRSGPSSRKGARFEVRGSRFEVAAKFKSDCWGKEREGKVARRVGWSYRLGERATTISTSRRVECGQRGRSDLNTPASKTHRATSEKRLAPSIKPLGLDFCFIPLLHMLLGTTNFVS